MSWAIFRDAHLRAIGEMLNDGATERVVAVVGGALLDETLRRTLAERLHNDPETTDKLLRVGRPLGNTEPKIDLLYLLGAVERPTRNALYGLTQIRNFFAHDLEASFESKEKTFLDAMKILTLHDGRARYPHHFLNDDSGPKIEDMKTNRDRFIVNLKLSLIALMRDRLRHEAWSNIPRSEESVKAQWDEMLRKAAE